MWLFLVFTELFVRPFAAMARLSGTKHLKASPGGLLVAKLRYSRPATRVDATLFLLLSVTVEGGERR